MKLEKRWIVNVKPDALHPHDRRWLDADGRPTADRTRARRCTFAEAKAAARPISRSWNHARPSSQHVPPAGFVELADATEVGPLESY